ncbi:MAG: hypothetical protein GY799_31690 [Desulfobulbaceae bacterium]|nr:hypothetical protein [Desulfobulbaceae bacterium]
MNFDQTNKTKFPSVFILITAWQAHANLSIISESTNNCEGQQLGMHFIIDTKATIAVKKKRLRPGLYRSILKSYYPNSDLYEQFSLQRQFKNLRRHTYPKSDSPVDNEKSIGRLMDFSNADVKNVMTPLHVSVDGPIREKWVCFGVL